MAIDELTLEEGNLPNYPEIKLVLCPLCGYSYNRSIKVDESSGMGDPQAWVGRGNVIKIFMHGECGHYWNLCVWVHKGESYLYCESLETEQDQKDREEVGI